MALNYSNLEIGREQAVGFGFETTPGTTVTPTGWFRQTSADFHDTAKFADSNAALGRVEDTDDQMLVNESATGKLNGYLDDSMIGYLLANIFGSWTSAAHPSETTVYDTTFTTLQSIVPKTLTIVKKENVTNKRYGLGTLGDIEIDVKAGALPTVNTTVWTAKGVVGSDSVAYVSTNLFSPKHVNISLAANVAGLTTATPLTALSLKLKIDRKPADLTPLGTVDPLVFTTTPWTVTGEFVLPYDSLAEHDLTFNNTAQAMQIQFKNTDVTIGTASNPTLTFTAPKTRLQTWTPTFNLDQRIDQTVTFKCNLDATVGYMLQALLTNTKATYA